MAKNQEEFLHIVRNGYAAEQITPITIAHLSEVHIVAEPNESQPHVPCTALLFSYEKPDHGREAMVLDIDPYSLLMLAHKIQQKLDPTKQSQ